MTANVYLGDMGTYMLNTPSEEDLGLVLAVRLCDLLDDGMVKSHSTSQGSPRLMSSVYVLGIITLDMCEVFEG